MTTEHDANSEELRAAGDTPTDESESAKDTARQEEGVRAGGGASTEKPPQSTHDEAGQRAAPKDGEQRPLTDEERAELYRRQLKELRLLDVARDMMLTLVTVGYQKLGLTDDTRELRDLADARLAIELLRGVVDAVETAAGADEVETYRATLAQMQLNYARVAAE